MFHGRIMGIVEGTSTDIEEIGLLMGGQRTTNPLLSVAAN
jgi:hypothetical protein